MYIALFGSRFCTEGFRTFHTRYILTLATENEGNFLQFINNFTVISEGIHSCVRQHMHHVTCRRIYTQPGLASCGIPDRKDLGCLTNLAYRRLSNPQIRLWILIIVQPLKFSRCYFYPNVSPCEKPQSWHSVHSCDLHGSQKTSTFFFKYQLPIGFYTT